jgi:hypothetical protein
VEARRRTLSLADELPDDEGAIVRELVEELGATLVEDAVEPSLDSALEGRS